MATSQDISADSKSLRILHSRSLFLLYNVILLLCKGFYAF